MYEAMEDYDAGRDGDLTITKGEILTVLEANKNGWWLAENQKGEKGVVPVTYLQVC